MFVQYWRVWYVDPEYGMTSKNFNNEEAAYAFAATVNCYGVSKL